MTDEQLTVADPSVLAETARDKAYLNRLDANLAIAEQTLTKVVRSNPCI